MKKRTSDRLGLPKRSNILRFEDGKKVKNYWITSLHSNRNRRSVVKPLGEGGAGIVFLAYQDLHERARIKRAIKFFMYREDIAHETFHVHSAGISNKDFLNEIINISGFSHEHLVKVIDAGLYSVPRLDIPYIVTDYIEGPNLKQVIGSSNDNTDVTQSKDSIHFRARIAENPEEALNMLIQIATGIEFLHSHEFLHCDIAPKNIFLKRNENFKAIIGDLGAGRSLKRNRRIRVIGTKAYMPPELQSSLYKVVKFDLFRSFFPRWDLYAFALTGLELLQIVPKNKQLAWFKPTETMLKECRDGINYKTISEILSRLNWLLSINRTATNVPELSPTLLTKRRRLMPVEPLATTQRVQILTWHPALLRLAKVPQLTAAKHTFPGAIHTRYEHSLGTMETTRRYLMNLVGQQDFQELLNESKIETALLCALLSSITRYPFSTVIRELQRFNDNFSETFSKKEILEEVLSIKNSEGATLPDLIARYFPRVDINCVKRILLDTKQTFTKEDELIYSLLNCSLDARVIDFVRRDALHLGISRHTFDLDELLAHLTIHHNRLALSIKGVSIAEEIITMRYTLFNRIYWNRPNRTFVAMIKYILIQLAHANRDFVRKLRRRIIIASEMDILSFLEEEAYNDGRDGLVNMVEILKEEGRRPYRVILEASPKEDSDLSVVCQRVREMNNGQTIELAERISNQIKNVLPSSTCISKIVPILLDIPFEPGSGNKLGDDIMVIYSNEPAQSENLSHVSGIIKGVNDSFNEYLCRMRLLIHPDLYPRSGDIKTVITRLIREYLLRTVQ